MPPLRILRLFAAGDPLLFEYYLTQAGLSIVGHRHSNPLEYSIQTEAVLGIAASLNYDIHDYTALTPTQQTLQNLAEEFGYLVALTEGLDQQPGTLPNPIKRMLHGDKEDDEGEEEEAPEEGADGTPPGEGAPPPPA